MPAIPLTAIYDSDKGSQPQEPAAKRRKVDPGIDCERDGICINRGGEVLNDVCILICEGEILPNGYVCFVFPLQILNLHILFQWCSSCRDCDGETFNCKICERGFCSICIEKPHEESEFICPSCHINRGSKKRNTTPYVSRDVFSALS